jgi:transcription-repair coupling factor (superfamily II helicase)
MERQIEQLMEWLTAMAAQIPAADGLTDAERQADAKARDEAVLAV